jgi:hypothetical protein
MWIEDRGLFIPAEKILSSPCIGIAYAKKDALLPNHFFVDSE